MVSLQAFVLEPSGYLPSYPLSLAVQSRSQTAVGITWNMQALGMGAFLGVANASDQPPKFIHLKYCPPDGVVYKRVAIVGKGRSWM